MNNETFFPDKIIAASQNIVINFHLQRLLDRRNGLITEEESYRNPVLHDFALAFTGALLCVSPSGLHKTEMGFMCFSEILGQNPVMLYYEPEDMDLDQVLIKPATYKLYIRGSGEQLSGFHYIFTPSTMELESWKYYEDDTGKPCIEQIPIVRAASTLHELASLSTVTHQ